MKNKLWYALMFLPIGAIAQTGLGLWSSVGIDKKLGKKWGVSLEAQTRFVDDVSYLRTYFGEVGVGRKLGKHWEFSGYYRWIQRRKDETKLFKTRHRFFGDLRYSKKIKKIKFENRIRYQHQFRDNDGEIGFDVSYLRNKIELGYPNKSIFTPYASADLFYGIGIGFEQVRPKVGTNIKIHKHHILDISIFSDLQLLENQTSSPIIGLGYKAKF